MERSRSEGPPTIGEAIALWLVHLELRGRPATTRRTYHSLLVSLADVSDPLASLDAERCNALVSERFRSQSRSTAATTRAALGSFLRYCREQGWTAETMRDVPRPSVPIKVHRYLSKDELGRIFALGEDRPLLLLLLTGCRVAELCGLRWQDYTGTELRVLFTKGGKPRTVAVNPALRAALDSMEHADGPILGLTPTTVRRKLVRLGKRARVAGLHPHLFRATWATHFLIEAGIESKGALKALGGWSSDSMVDHYTRSAICDAALKRAHELDLTARLLDR